MISATTILKDLPVEVRLNRLEALVEASQALNRAAGLDDILHAILDLIPAQLDCERATAFIRDKRTGKLHARQMSGSEHIEIVLERGVGIAGYVAESGESVLSNNVPADPRFDNSTDRRTGFLTMSMLCVPLRKPDSEPMGSLQAINARAGGFSKADLAYLEAFAALAAFAVEREQLAQEAIRSKLISTELELARKIQQRLLPVAGGINLPSPYSAWGISQACYDVGGDAYDVLTLPSGECAFWVADVSGKGIGAALLMTTLQTELRALVHEESDLALLTAELNTRVNTVAPLGTFATLFIGVLSAEAQRLRYVNAGHLPPLWLPRLLSDPRKCEEGGMPIGVSPSSFYEVGETRFAPGERLALFTDGVTDAENTSGATYEVEGLVASLARLSPQSIEQTGRAVFEDLDHFRIGVSAKDDTTFLIIGMD